MAEQSGAGKTAAVVGIAGAVGHALAAALLETGYRVAGSAEEPAALEAAIADFVPAYGDAFEPLLGRADDPALADWTIGEFRPDLVVLVASADDGTAVQETFLWCREVVTGLLAHSTTIVVSGHPAVEELVEDAARQPGSARFHIRFLTQDTAATAGEVVAAVLAKAGVRLGSEPGVRTARTPPQSGPGH